MTYYEQLEDPRWKAKRDEILKRDRHTCVNCKSTTRELHVHHIRYFRGWKAWDYHNSWLITLCKICHQDQHGLYNGFVEPDDKRKELELRWGRDNAFNMPDNIKYHRMIVLKIY